MKQSVDTVLAADIFQLVVISICVIIFLYVRLACGGKARYFVHLALAYIGIGAVYLFDAAAQSWFYFANKQPSRETVAIIQMINSSFSLLNTAFFISSWYLMRDFRLEQKTDPHSAEPTMSKPFVATVIAGLVTGISAYIVMANFLIQNKPLLIIFSGIEIILGISAAALVGWEFFCIPIIGDQEEGSLFTSEQSHLIFRMITLALFLAFGLFQISYLFAIIPEEPSLIFIFPTGQAYQWLAILKLLCAGAAGILGLHALPSVRWKHRQPVQQPEHTLTNKRMQRRPRSE